MRGMRVAVVAVIAIAGLVLAGCGEQSRQDEVAARGEQVMPFDLDRTTHRFIDQDDGLLETVVSDDTTDTEQIKLIRGHLTKETTRFKRGDYSDPATIHGEEMPGLRALQQSADRITVTYTELPAGASIRWRTDDPALVEALHKWGAAQIQDHGKHAE